MSLINKKSFGLVLGGGGARGFFHMGVIKAIQELKIPINQISGTSIGAVVGAIYAANPQIDFEKIANEIDFLKLTQTLILATQTRSQDSIKKFLKTYIKVSDFSDLKIPLVFSATDINQKSEVVFDHGPIFPGLIAAVSLPGIFPPTQIKDRLLLDGGIVNNIPISLLKPNLKLIISDITGPIKKIHQKTSAIDILYSSLALMQQNTSLQNLKTLKKNQYVYLNLNDQDVFILDFRKKNYQALIDLGYQSLMAQKNIL